MSPCRLHGTADAAKVAICHDNCNLYGPGPWHVMTQQSPARGVGTRQGSVIFRVSNGLLNDAALFDAGFLTGEIAQVVKLGATHFTVLVDGDGVDER